MHLSMLLVGEYNTYPTYCNDVASSCLTIYYGHGFYSKDNNKRFDIFPPKTGGCSEGLGVVWFFFKQHNRDSNSRPKVSDGYDVTSELPGRAPLAERILTFWASTFRGWEHYWL